MYNKILTKRPNGLIARLYMCTADFVLKLISFTRQYLGTRFVKICKISLEEKIDLDLMTCL